MAGPFDLSSRRIRVAKWLETPPADHRPRPLVVRRLSDAAEPELLVDLRRHPHLHAGGADRHRHRAGDALHRRTARWPSTRSSASCATSTTAGCCATCTPTAPRCSSSPSTSTSSAASTTAPTRRRARCCGSSACIIFLLMMATAFMGYVLPWGQMSFWGATVITNLFSAIPLVGEAIVTWLWGGFSVDNADAQPLLLAALPAAVHDRRRRRAAHLGAARPRQRTTRPASTSRASRTPCPSTPTTRSRTRFGLSRVPDPVRLARLLPARTTSATRTTTSRPTRW